jgi:D-alanine-D-alanine ligase
MKRKKIRVGVIFGGKSGEHEVSLISARNVMDAIDQSKYEIVPIGINKSGLWLSGDKVTAYLTAESNMPPQLQAQVEPTEPKSGLVPFLDASLTTGGADLGELDVIFPILHGPMGEDGTVQGFLELADLPYVGCGVTGSAVAMDKAVAKDIFRANGLPIVSHRVILRRTWQAKPEQIIAELEADLRYPMFVKPANLGSSVGITKAKDQAGLRAGLDEAARYDRKLVIEQGLDAREIEVSVLGNDEPMASVPGEVIPSREFYSYAAKYVDDHSRLLIPASLSPEVTEALQTMAVKAFQALDCAGLARVDFLVDKSTDEIFLNEINTMPGFTSISMYPKLWEASGLSYTELIDRLIALALERFEDKQQSSSSFDVAQAE